MGQIARACQGGLDGLRRSNAQRPVSELAAFRLEMTGPITLVLDNARYQRNAVVQALAAEPGFSLLLVPSYSPNLNLTDSNQPSQPRGSGRCRSSSADS